MFLVCVLRGPGSNDTWGPTGILNAQFVDFQSHFTGVLSETADSRAKAGKIQDEPGILCSAKEKCSKNYADMSKVLRRQSEGAPNGHIWNH